MTTVLKNFVTIRRTKGDIIKPQTYHSVIEMILGILNKYDYSQFNDAYKSFLAHVKNYNDPHHVTSFDFSSEIIDRIYLIYAQMTASPLSEAAFKTQIVPTLGFLELIRRIILNRYIYDMIKNPDGSVNRVVDVYVNTDWGRYVTDGTKVRLTFDAPMVDEKDFLRKGWVINASPIPIVFNADNLDLVVSESSTIFHTSSTCPYYSVSDSGNGYPITLFNSSNDFSIDMSLVNSPATKTTILTLMNSVNTFRIFMNPDRSLELRFDNSVLEASTPCNDGKFTLTMTSGGVITIVSFNDGITITNNYTVNLVNIKTFVSGVIGIPMENLFLPQFGLRELTVYKDVYFEIDTNVPIPMIFLTPPADALDVTGTLADNTPSAIFDAQAGYNLYLTVTGTWTGIIYVEHSIDNGATWNKITFANGTAVYNTTTNCDEVVMFVSDPKSLYRLNGSISSGSPSFRLAQ